MPHRLSLGTVLPDGSSLKQSCANAVNLNSDDPRAVAIINEACETLLYGDIRSGSAKWPGLTGKYRFCTNNSCITHIREIETVECWWLDGAPQEIRNQYYESLLEIGLLGDINRNGWQLIDDGEGCTFDDTSGANKKLAIYCDVEESPATTMTIRFYNDSEQKARIEYPAFSGKWIEGETLALPAAGNYQLTAAKVGRGGVYSVIKPKTKGVVRLYEYDTIAHTYKPLGYYEPSETMPIYRRSRIPGLGKSSAARSVVVLAKFRFIPAYDDADLIQIPHAGAVRLACQAVHYEKAHLFQDAATAWGAAFGRLHSQLNHFAGSGTKVAMKMANTSTWGAGGCNIR